MIHNRVLEAANRQLYPKIESEVSLKHGEFFETYFTSREYAVRFATLDDMDALMEIEAQCWARPIQTDQAIIKKRLVDSACLTFVLEHKGKVIGCNYAQRINEESIKEMNISTVDSYRVATGTCIQLITINILPKYQDRGWGNELLEFILQYASLHSEVEKVRAVTRCRDFRKSNCHTLEAYLQSIYENNLFNDPTLLMHQLHGAKVLGLIEGYRPKDEDNQGYGILIEYDIKNRPWGGVLKETMKKKPVGGRHEVLEHIKSKLGIEDLQQEKTLRELGFDSMDFVELLLIINKGLGTNMKIADLNQKTVGELLALGKDEDVKGIASPQKPLKSRIRQLMRDYEELVPLAIEGEGPCTFWIHPLSGDVGIYQSIAERSDDSFKVLAIKAPGFLSTTKQPLKSVEEMAQYYCDIVTATDPIGPYNLIGFSYGGTVAYEMVRLLQEKGKKVDNLIMVESLFVTQEETHLFQTSYRNNLLMNANFMLLTLLNREQDLKKESNGQVDGEFYKISEDQVKHVLDSDLMDHLIKLCKEKGLKQSEEALKDKLETMSKVHIANLEAIQKYTITRLPDSKALKAWLFRTSLANATSQNIWNPDYLEAIQKTKGSLLPLLSGWRSVLSDLETVVLEGDNHFDILHNKLSVATFYEYCKQIIMGEPCAFKAQQGLTTDENMNRNERTPIAIVGMSGRFPDANNIQTFWENLKKGHNSIKEFPRDRGFDIQEYYDVRKKTQDKTYSKWGGFLEDIDKFDPLFFKIGPKEAQLMDPSERLFLQEAWHAIEDAGYNPRSLSGAPWGVFSCAKGDYAMTIQEQMKSYYVPTDSYAASRLSYLLNLVGPAMTIDTACSSTLSAVVVACNSLTLGECEAAVVGGGAVYTTPNILIGSSQSLLLSPDGQCFTFDERANGTVVAEAIGAVVLKKLDRAIEDQDHIYGIIKGWGMNQDGKTNGFTAPSGQAQRRLQTDIYNKFKIHPENITMVETHGTGTTLGDAIEFNALTDTFRQYTSKANYCALGSLKTNIGHAFFGAGIAGFIKTALAVNYGQIPPSLNYENPSPKIELEGSPFYVNTALREWQTPLNQPRCAGVSAFGATGTNAHVVIQAYEAEIKDGTEEIDRAAIMFILSAKDEHRLKAYAQDFLEQLERGIYKEEDLNSIGYTLQVGREHMAYRLGMIVTSIDEIKEALLKYLERNQNGDYQGYYVNKGNKNSKTVNEQVIEEAQQLWKEKKDPRLLELWIEGSAIHWEALYEEKVRRISLPVYPFAKERYWVEPNAETSNRSQETETPILMSFTEEWEEEPLKPIISTAKETIICFLSKPENQRNFTLQLEKYNPNAEVVFVGREIDKGQGASTIYSIDETDKASYIETFRKIHAKYNKRLSIVYLWAYENPASELDYDNILHIYQAITQEKIEANRLLLGGIDRQGVEGCYLDSWIGFERSIGPMMSRTRIKVVIHSKNQVDEFKPSPEDILHILQELSVESGHASVLYREGKRNSHRLKEQALSHNVSSIKEGGTYLVTGGLGALGFIVSKYLAEEYKVNLILTGRKSLDRNQQMHIDVLEKLGSQVLYVQADICHQEAMKKGIEEANQKFGVINGVIHAAGVVSKESVEQKTKETFNNTLKPKVMGTQIIDRLLADQPIDFICYFSSAAAILGDFGACDYAVANRFQVAYAHYRKKKQMVGKAIAINWPLWRDGGMGLGEESNNKYLASSGQEYLETKEGLKAFEALLLQVDAQYLLIKGYPNKVRNFLKISKDTINKKATIDLSQVATSINVAEEIREVEKEAKSRLTQEMIEKDIKKLISNSYAIPYEKIDVNEHLMEYGFDSINLFEFANELTDTFGFKVTPAILLSYSTISRFAEYLMNEFRETLEVYYQLDAVEEEAKLEAAPVHTENKAIDEPIAVIGMSGLFPKANDVTRLWDHLYQNKVCLTEVPKERWDWRQYSHQLSSEESGKWGGFIEDVTAFDPLFFGISPSEAVMMDPCQRLFVQEAWHAFEDAGYISENIKGTSCGVYVGIEEGDYGFMAKQQGIHYSNQNAVLSARIAYALDLKGPNMSITASCSSGLVAVHEACQALRHGDCDMALAGGVNVFVSPSAHIGMGMLDLLSPTGRANVFDKRADGLVPSEAVAAVVLKPLSKAIRDKDNIYGCIRGSGVNSNGKGHGIMSPNPLRQAELMQTTWDKYGVAPSDISYIISHSIGTQLGDAAEIEGLTQAFSPYKGSQPYCYLSSVKPTVGHTFAASGIVSLITMLMGMKHRIRLGMPHLEQLNESIDLTRTPFIIEKQHTPWTVEDGQKRVGAVSTSSNSGTNAFAIIEEYESQEEAIILKEKGLFIFSAKNNQRLKDMMTAFINYLDRQETVDMRNLAYTLQLGREEMISRVAIIASTQDELVEAIRCYVRAVNSQDKVMYEVPVFTGNIQAMNKQDIPQYSTTIIKEAIDKDNLSMLASYWVAGGKIPWDKFYEEKKAQVISVPTYPFSKESYWLKDAQNVYASAINETNKTDNNTAVEERAETEEGGISDKMRVYLSKLLSIPKQEINVDRPLQEYGIDSILAMKLKRYLESQYPVTLSNRDIWRYPSVRELAGYLEAVCGVTSVASSINEDEVNVKEYRDEHIVSGIEEFLRGDITLSELEKSIGVEKHGRY